MDFKKFVVGNEIDKLMRKNNYFQGICMKNRHMQQFVIDYLCGNVLEMTQSLMRQPVMVMILLL